VSKEHGTSEADEADCFFGVLCETCRAALERRLEALGMRITYFATGPLAEASAPYGESPYRSAEREVGTEMWSLCAGGGEAKLPYTC
jgi:hypothetical protein